MKPSTVLSFLALAFPFASGSLLRKRHGEVAHRARGDVDIQKRSFTNARFTYYDVGLGACGFWNKPSDMVVALNVAQFGPGYPGQYCNQTITISYNGQTVQATIVDKCAECPLAGLDFSRGLFDRFAPEAQGVLQGDWWFDNN